MDLREAYRILGVPESASREEVEKQYAVWVRKDRALKRAQAQAEADEHFDFGEINTAYRTIIDHYHQLEDQSKPKRDPRIEKLDHFWTYYKYHVIGAIILIIGIVYAVNSIIESQQEKARLAALPPPDATMMMFGDFYEPKLTNLEESVLLAKPEWQRVVFNHTYVPSQITSEFDVALQQKAIVTLVTDRSDVYMTDRNNLQNLVNQGLFRPLDEYEERLKASVGEENLVYLRTEPSGLNPDEQPGELHLYTIRLPIKQEYSALSDEVVAGIHVGSENIENALQLIEVLAKGL